MAHARIVLFITIVFAYYYHYIWYARLSSSTYCAKTVLFSVLGLCGAIRVSHPLKALFLACFLKISIVFFLFDT